MTGQNFVLWFLQVVSTLLYFLASQQSKFAFATLFSSITTNEIDHVSKSELHPSSPGGAKWLLLFVLFFEILVPPGAPGSNQMCLCDSCRYFPEGNLKSKN